MQDYDFGCMPAPLKITKNPQHKEPIYVLVKVGNAYRICIKNPQGLTAGVLLGNDFDDDIAELINNFDCSDEAKIKLLDQYQELKDKPGKQLSTPPTSGGYDSLHQKKPPKEDFSLWNSPPSFLQYRK